MTVFLWTLTAIAWLGSALIVAHEYAAAPLADDDGEDRAMWPFSKPVPPAPTSDNRVWNEDWKVGDTAECIVNGGKRVWRDSLPPWERPAFGQRLIVSGFPEGLIAGSGIWAYFLHFSDWPVCLTTTAFRKVRPVEKSEIVERILNATPGQDRLVETS